jgi:hypothetical protein
MSYIGAGSKQFPQEVLADKVGATGDEEGFQICFIFCHLPLVPHIFAKP